MSKQWHKGPPPSVGWWPCRSRRWKNSIRWWDGRRWSAAALSSDSSELAHVISSITEYVQHDIEWTDRPKSWPARSKT